MLLAQGRGNLDGLDGVEDTPDGQDSDSCRSGSNADKPRARDPLADESDDALIALGKMLNDAGRMLWKRVNVASLRKGKSKSKAKSESFDIATIRAEDDLASQIEGSSTSDSGSTLNYETSPDSAPVSPVDALSEAELKALSCGDVDPMARAAPIAIVVT